MSCIATYACHGIKAAEEGDTLGPWVKIAFGGGGEDITVGNLSSPANNNAACIKSFEFGYSDGLTVRVVVQDQQGGSFVKFMEHCIKHYACMKSPASIEMSFSFGWTKAGCQGAYAPSSSPKYSAIMDSVETSYSDGKFTFELTGKDKGSRMFEGGIDKIYGGDGEKLAIPITSAIREMMTAGPSPNITNVKFQRIENGSAVPCPFKKGGIPGPKGKWSTEGQDKLQAAKRWLERWPTDRDRGWKATYNFEIPGGEIIFWEDRSPQCSAKGDDYWDESCVGTYIVNGSKQSSVLEFSPKVRWDFSRLTSVGGGTASSDVNSIQTQGAKNPGNPCGTLGRDANPGAGHTVATNPTENDRAINGNMWQKDAAKNDAIAMKANRLTTDPIAADLVVVGDPSLVPPSDGLYQKSCAIIVINPYYIKEGGSGCGDWITEPPCNPVFSSKAWQIASITHRIELGSFTTILNVFLAAPGEDLDAGQPIGGWTGGWSPPPC